MQIDKILATVQSFVGDRGGDAASIQPKTPLLGEGYIDSFALIELIGTLEEALGLQIPDGALIPEDFETVETLFDRLKVVESG